MLINGQSRRTEQNDKADLASQQSQMLTRALIGIA